jgi:hypothetical protein
MPEISGYVQAYGVGALKDPRAMAKVGFPRASKPSNTPITPLS